MFQIFIKKKNNLNKSNKINKIELNILVSRSDKT